MSDTRFGGALDPEELIAQVERDVLAAEERAATATSLVQRIQEIDVQRSARDVRVRVDASGRLTHISFDDQFATRTAAQLEAAVMAAVQDAQRTAALAAIQLAEDTVGAGMAT